MCGLVLSLFVLDQERLIKDCQKRCVEEKNYSWTDIFADPRLQRSKHSGNCARSSAKQAGTGIVFNTQTIVVHGDRKSHPKLHYKTT